MTHGNLAAAAGDAQRLAKALSRQDMKAAVALLHQITAKISTAIDIETLFEKEKGIRND